MLPATGKAESGKNDRRTSTTAATTWTASPILPERMVIPAPAEGEFDATRLHRQEPWAEEPLLESNGFRRIPHPHW